MRLLPRGGACLALAFLATASRAVLAAPVFDPSNFDTTCAPCRDFDQYANGGWKARTKMPAAYARFGSFTDLADRNQAILLRIMQHAATAKAAPGSTDAKLGAYWSSCMDSAAAEAAGTKPIQPLLDAVDGLKSTSELGRQLAWLHVHGVSALFGLGGFQDPKNSGRVIATAGQGGLGLPDRDYYTKTDSASTALRSEYLQHVARSFQLLGDDAATAAKRADDVMAIEKALALASMTNVQRRDPQATYHLMATDTMMVLCPSLAW